MANARTLIGMARLLQRISRRIATPTYAYDVSKSKTGRRHEEAKEWQKDMQADAEEER